MENNSHICNQSAGSVGQFGKSSHWLRRIWQIARAVLRGYLTGQPINDERPRKGCC
ncbi:MAG: hypothetical protein KA368_02270 [Acidobacteria bacterium]|nr:hypothetical protein [Acidobacteriota bacterium]